MKKALYLSLLLFFTATILFSQVKVRGYYRKDGTYVRPHQRTRPNSTVTDNYSYKGNVNPHTGEVGTKTYSGTATSTSSGAQSSVTYIGAKTPEQNNVGQKLYNKVPTSYNAKTNNLSTFHTTYTPSGTKERVFIEANKTVEVVGKTDNGFLLVKYDNVEGFIRQSEADSIISVVPISTQQYQPAIFTPSPYSEIDTTDFKYAVTVAELAFLRESAETKESNIILKLRPGSPIKVLKPHTDSFWIVRYRDKTGLMLDTFFRVIPENEIMDILRNKYRPLEYKALNAESNKTKKKFLGIF